MDSLRFSGVVSIGASRVSRSLVARRNLVGLLERRLGRLARISEERTCRVACIVRRCLRSSAPRLPRGCCHEDAEKGRPR